MHIAKIRNVQAMPAGEVGAKIFGIDFDGAQSAENSKAQEALEGRGVLGMM